MAGVHQIYELNNFQLKKGNEKKNKIPFENQKKRGSFPDSIFFQKFILRNRLRECY